MTLDVVRYSRVKSQAIALAPSVLRLFLAQIDDLAELKLSIFFLFAIQQKEGHQRFLRYADFLEDDSLMAGLRRLDADAGDHAALDAAIGRARDRGTLLEAAATLAGARQRFFMLNDDMGRLIQGQILAGEWTPTGLDDIEILPLRPTIFSLYESNIGLLTPMIIEALKDAEAEYPEQWIEDAIRLAVERNARSWRYISKVLENWQREGRAGEKAGRPLDRHEQYAAGEWGDFIDG